MAHFAKVVNDKVVEVITAEQDFIDQYDDGLNDGGEWIQTSYNTLQNKHNSGDNSKAFRGNYAGIGHTWDEDNNIFWPKKPYASWVKDTSDASWHSPIGDAPDLGAESETHHYEWNESNQSWDKTEQ